MERKFESMNLTGTSTETYASEFEEWQNFSSGRGTNEWPNTGVAFLIRKHYEVKFNRISNGIANLELNLGNGSLGIQERYAPTHSSEDKKGKETSTEN